MGACVILFQKMNKRLYNKYMKSKSIKTGILSIFLLSFLLPLSSQAAVSCSFDRSLELGDEGEDVRCLQRFLNDAGFTVAESGVGSPGNETSLFRTLTAEAVSRWQAANGITPASGFFGPLSIGHYRSQNQNGGNENMNNNASNVGAAVSAIAAATGENADDINSQVQAILAAVGQGPSSTASNSSSAVTSNEGTSIAKEAKDKIQDAIRMIEDAEDQYEDALDDGDPVGTAESDIEKAKEDLFDAVLSYFDEDYEDAYDYADDAEDNAEDAFDEAGGQDSEDEAEELLMKLEPI